MLLRNHFAAHDCSALGVWHSLNPDGEHALNAACKSTGSGSSETNLSRAVIVTEIGATFLQMRVFVQLDGIFSCTVLLQRGKPNKTRDSLVSGLRTNIDEYPTNRPATNVLNREQTRMILIHSSGVIFNIFAAILNV